MRGSVFALLLLTTALGVALAVPASALAKAKKTLPKPVSVARPVFERDGSFGFCLADHAFADGRQLTLAIHRGGKTNLGLTIPEGGFVAGERYDLTVAPAPGVLVRKVHAEALDPDALLLQLGDDEPFVTALTRSKTLTITGGGASMDFTVPQMGAFADGVRRCVAANRNRTDKAVAAAEQVLPEPLKALLVTAGFRDVAPLDMGDVPPERRAADFAWRTGNLLGGVREREALPGKSLGDMAGIYLQGLKKSCVGDFRATMDREDSVAAGLKLRTAEAHCRASGAGPTATVHVAILFYLTSTNLVTVFTHEADDAHQEEAKAARDALARTVIGLARQTEAGKGEPGKGP